MRVTSKGQVTIPQEIRERAGFIPGTELEFRLGDLANGAAVHELEIGNHIDTVDAQIVPGDAALDQEFSFTDRSNLQPGDYYYLRVRQVDGSTAWSSPFWVGVDAE